MHLSSGLYARRHQRSSTADVIFLWPRARLHVTHIQSNFPHNQFLFQKLFTLIRICESIFNRPFNSQGALEKAKYAVESQYAVVGVLEDLNTTLTVLENYIPRFFRGASEVYHGNAYGAELKKNRKKKEKTNCFHIIVRKTERNQLTVQRRTHSI